MKYLSHYEETTPTSDRHAFFFREGEKQALYVETYLGQAAALELGYFEEAEVGLNKMKTDSPTYTLILDYPAVSQSEALSLTLGELQRAGVLSAAPLSEWTEGIREDFAGHAEADLFLRLIAQAEQIMSDPEGAEELELRTTTWREFKELLDEDLSEEECQDKERRLEEYRAEEAQRERESLERGEARLRAARKKQTPPERLLD